MEKLEWCGYPVVENFEDMFIRFDRMYKRDKHTDRQTRHDDIGRACIVSWSKNQTVIDCLQLLDTETRDDEKNDVLSEKLHFHFLGE